MFAAVSCYQYIVSLEQSETTTVMEAKTLRSASFGRGNEALRDSSTAVADRY
ncbi:hypothetical protein [Brevibacillus choshinensis]|uniref:hypothetical protein n=1 Tax=Brevibacillus choshinensis TaxID=54911 RepID=UPI002E209A89|nr:hypothetical protein [Brevibacillus choshinensis]